jgi:hypothetical protein
MLSQSLSDSFNFGNILRLNGKNVRLGDDINIFKGHEEGKVITLRWSNASTIDIPEFNTPTLLDDFFHLFHWNSMVIRKNAEGTVTKEQQAESNEIFKSLEGSFFHLTDGKEQGQLIAAIKKQFRLINKIEKTNKLLRIKRASVPRLEELLDFIKARDASDYRPKDLEIKIRYNSASSECEILEHAIINENGDDVFRLTFSATGKIDITSNIIPNNQLRKSRLDILKGVDKSSILLFEPQAQHHTSRDERFAGNAFAAYCTNYIAGVTSLLCEPFTQEKIYHVSPLRALPQRYYMLEKSAIHKTINSDDGTQVLEVLKNNAKILSEVNRFFEDFDIVIKPVKVRDVIHKISITQNGLAVDLTDVGFGISQVLPILVQIFLCENDSIIIIEQPEIHLHPNMQALLANVFAKISKENRKKLIIETHSETIIRRLQRLYLDPDFDLEHEDLKIYQFTRNQDGSSTVSGDSFGPLGEMKWLKGFKDMEVSDTIEIQRLKVEKLKRKDSNHNA